VSIGYQVGVTPLQMAAAVSSIANGGNLFEPRAVRAVIRDSKRTVVPHKSVRRTVSATTATELTRMMEGVVQRGTAKPAAVPGYLVAGKTGTAQKIVEGHYSHSEFNASFVGFVPSTRPVFTIVVVIDSPHGKNGYFGGQVAAPVFQKIADAALRHAGVPATLNPPPPVLVAERHQTPAQPTAGPVSPLPIAPPHGPAPGPAVPDLRGLSARDALRALAELGLTVRLNGAGVVIDQEPEPGARIDRSSSATLWLRRQPVLRASTGSEP
jgi:membrane peptidoglycan carboxypeptidase